MNKLEIVRAGAGSGKTTDLCQTVAEAVQGGLDPARILATTFTKKAAAELKGRVQAELLADAGGKTKAHRQADRLELAAIGTVDSVAHQLVSRYAVEMGLSPRLEVTTESVGERMLAELLAGNPSDSWQTLLDCAERLGIDDLHSRILTLFSKKRENRIGNADFASHLSDSANRVCELLARGQTADFDAPIGDLYQLVKDAVEQMSDLSDTTAKTRQACQKLRRIRSANVPHWGKYLEAGKLEAGKKSGADARLEPLRNHAASVHRHGRLHDDLRTFAKLIAGETIGLETRYTAYKSQRGFVDFTDLEILLLQLLENDALSSQLGEDFDLILVDEFQDTNPLQLAIFQRLRQLSPRSRWVGDHKQAIYGFRGTDPQLVSNVWESAAGAACKELPKNYRSQAGLVKFVGNVFAPALGEDARQQPHKPASPRGVERWLYDSKNQGDDALALACGIAQLGHEAIRWGDIAVLERSNRGVAQVAEALDQLGIPYLRESPGLLETREGVLSLAGLRLVADRSDALAAATVLHLLDNSGDETPSWIIERLQTLRCQPDSSEASEEGALRYQLPWSDDPSFSRLEMIESSIAAPTFVVHQVIEALDLPTRVGAWDDPGLRCANLDSLLRHAREYEEIVIEAGQAATLTGLILYLEQLAAEGEDVRFPPLGHDAVTLSTYHGAKGLEWPVVVLSGLDASYSPDMWKPVVTGGGEATEDPLGGRELRSWTWPFGVTDGRYGRRRKGSDLEKDATSSPEGQHQEAQERKECLRLLYVGCTRAKQKLVFAHRRGKSAWLDCLDVVDSLLDCRQEEGEYDLEGTDTTYVLRHLRADLPESCRVEPKSHQRWFAPAANPNPPGYGRRFHAPSQASTASTDARFELEELSGGSYFPSACEESQYCDIGEAVHSYFAALPSIRALTDQEKQRVAERCLNAFSVSGLLPPTTLVTAGERFFEWVESNFPDARWHVEVPLTAPRAAGGQWNGTADLLLQLPSGEVILIDHKTGPIRREDCAFKAATFAGQLEAYREVLTTAGERVDAAHIHFPMAGVLARMQ
ncbi:MAG: UvrD-helicase domain-containing protein [Candidatus Paceibacterota bacterium]